MKIKCQKVDLLNGISIVSKAVPNKSTMSILECILIDTREGEIKLVANDNELGIQTIVEGSVVEKGMIALDSKLFMDIIRKLPDSDVYIESDDNLVTSIKCEKAKFNIIGKSGEEYTFLPTIEKIDSLVISQFTLKEMIRQTIFSISDNDNNKAMTGELLEIKDNMLKMVALDGHRIAYRKVDLKMVFPNKKVIVPGKTLSEISKILSNDTEKDVYIFFTDKHILFEFDNTTVVSRLIEGEFFRIDQMILSDYETKVHINKKELFDCIERANLLIKEGDKKPIILNIDDENMSLKVNSTMGSLDEDIDIYKQGKDLMIGFNPKFMIDVLRVIDDEEIDIYLVNSKAPCFIRDAQEDYIYMVLPINFTTVG